MKWAGWALLVVGLLAVGTVGAFALYLHGQRECHEIGCK